MPGNSFGQSFRITTFGESHGPAVGVVIDGCPAGLELDVAAVQRDLDRRKPGQSKITTQRKEGDEVEFLSGLFEGRTTGAPVSALIRNRDQRSQDYDHLRSAFRPSHADFTYQEKFGWRDHRGGGRSSARETAARVVAGAVAKQLLAEAGVSIVAWVSQVGDVVAPDLKRVSAEAVEKTMVRCPDRAAAAQMVGLIESVRKQGDTVGGVVTGLLRGVPAGLGEPAFDKLHADLAKAMMSINAAKGFEYGSGFAGVAQRGSEHNDRFIRKGRKIVTETNRSGGIQGGISNGMDVRFRVAFKPVATLLKPQKSVDGRGREIELAGRGRHDPCVVPRAVPIVEAMAALVLADHYLRNRMARL